MNAKQKIDEGELQKAVELLDRVLGADARRPGAAAKLPAVIRVIESLEAAGGMGFPVFPASYAGVGDNDPPVYDLSGIVYGDVQETIKGKGRTTVQRPQVIRAERCTIDSPQSQANRTEVAFVEDEQLQSLVPQASASIPRKEGRNGEESVMRLPHRIADFRVRASDKHKDVKAAIADFANGNSLKLLQLMPTSVVFGFWDSRGEGTQPKHARILLSRIDAFDVIPCRRHALYSGPYSADEFAEVVLERPATGKGEEDKMGELGYKSVPSEGLGGVLVKDRIERLALISLTDIARLCCRNENGEVDKPKTNAARRYVFVLAALAEAYPRSTGSHRLRSGCELVSKASHVVDLRGGDSTYTDGDALRGLYANRDVLVAVATQAKGILEIPDQAGTFTLSKEALRAEFPTASVPSPPAAGTAASDGSNAPKSPRKPSKRSR
ncbi:MAG: type I-U CRISPR-associated RAMP protein Csb1/Cas7u [Acidobacteria bacterium]|nr:type I-U CRISPR-associated RAMP protein Csb1/Cas7u [Acidobacteriota bacterium]